MRSVGLFDEEIALALTREEWQLLMRPIAAGEWGGAQRCADMLQRRLKTAHGALSTSELDDVYVKAWAYGNGTYQQHYFRPVLRAARRAGWWPERTLRIEVLQKRRPGRQWGTPG